MILSPFVRATGLDSPAAEPGVSVARVVVRTIIVALGLLVGAILGLIGALASGVLMVC